MPRRREFFSIAAAALIHVAVACRKQTMSAADISKLPVVSARLGETLVEVRDHSTYRLNLSRVTDDDLTNATTPCVFTYTGQNGFTLPPTRFVSLETRAAVVVSLRVSPQLEYLDQNGVLSLADSVPAILRDAGWKPTDRPMVSRPELLVLLRDESSPEERSWIIGGFVNGPENIDLRLLRGYRKNPKKGLLAPLFGGNGLFLLNVECRDGQLAERCNQISGMLRVEDGLSRDSFGRPIELDSYTARVKRLLAR